MLVVIEPFSASLINELILNRVFYLGAHYSGNSKGDVTSTDPTGQYGHSYMNRATQVQHTSSLTNAVPRF